MVLGAYTIIGTLGLLVGLPINKVSTVDVIENIPVNNNFYDYYLSHKYISNDYYFILDVNNGSYVFKTNDYINCSYLNKSTTSNEKFVKFSFDYSSSINGTNNNVYYIFHCSDTEYLTDLSIINNTADIVTSETLNFTLDINQMYFGVLTSKYTKLDSDSIIGSVSSGLGLIDDITKQFGNGFGALIWDNSKNQLTTFGNFALIFLGVSITFSIVKLCMSLIRSKTGS